MTKDSICKDCVSRKHIVYQEKGVERDLLHSEEETSCKQRMVRDVSGDIKILECSEFSRKITKIPPPDPSRFHIVEDTRWKFSTVNHYFQMFRELFRGKT